MTGRAAASRAAFWDTSAVVPLCCHQQTTDAARAASRRFPRQVVWWGTRVEAVSAFSRLRRERLLSDDERSQTILRLTYLSQRWNEVQPVTEVRTLAERLLASHSIRTADALQLAAALLWCRERAHGRPFVAGDGALARTAAAEGFSVLLLDSL
jgi:predicted nucleic acid-binding protein